MAQVSAYLSPLPPPPPPVYSQNPYRSQSPQAETPFSETLAPSQPITRASNTAVARSIPRKPVSARPADGMPLQPAPAAPAAPVRAHTPGDRSIAESFAVSVEEHGRQMSPWGLTSDNGSVLRQSPDYDRLSPVPQNPPRRLAWQEHAQKMSDTAGEKVWSKSSPTQETNHDRPSTIQPPRHVSTPSWEDGSPSESFQPLQYHHQAFEDDIRVINKRTSRLTVRSTQSDGSPQSDRPYHGDQTGPSDLRQSMYGRPLQRPDSALSWTSDLRGRTRSPQFSPNNAARAASAHSRSGSLSYVDLLNVPYPQPPPTGAENLVNAQLRAAVGTNASLLSTRKTLEMYRANIKKTTDPATQYEFAMFLVSAAREANLDEEEVSVSGFSDKSSGSVQGDLLKEAKHILQRLSDRSYPFAQYYLADGLASGLFNKGKADHDRAFPLFLSASKHGHAEAGYRTALCHEFGWGCRVDAAKAVQFYQHAASKNHPGAMLRLAHACLMGDMGLGKRYKEGIRWLKRAAESADFQYNSAPYDLGVLHETGFGDDIFRDESYTAQLFTKSADLGHPEANYRLGDSYEHSKLNCPRDPALSVHFYTGAAQKGHALAQMALCAWYMVGVEPVLEKDENEAYEWAKKAAESGLPKAEYAVGYFTEMGIGCRRDPLEANVWYVRAADHGDERAKHRIAAIRAAATGANPVTAAIERKGLLTPSNDAGNVGPGKFKICTQVFYANALESTAASRKRGSACSSTDFASPEGLEGGT
jgi:TPR repeat protein